MAIGGMLFIALGIMAWSVVPAASADTIIASCQTSSNGNAYAFVYVDELSGGGFTIYHESLLHSYTNGQAKFTWVDWTTPSDGTKWIGYFSPSQLDFTQEKAYGITPPPYYTNSTTNDATPGGVAGAQISSGTASPTCSHYSPIRQTFEK